MPGFAQTEHRNDKTGLCQRMPYRARPQKRVLTAEMGSAHVLRLCWYAGTCQVRVTATTQSVGNSVDYASRGVGRESRIAPAVGCCFRDRMIYKNHEFRAKRRVTTSSRFSAADRHPSK